MAFKFSIRSSLESMDFNGLKSIDKIHSNHKVAPSNAPNHVQNVIEFFIWAYLVVAHQACRFRIRSRSIQTVLHILQLVEQYLDIAILLKCIVNCYSALSIVIVHCQPLLHSLHRCPPLFYTVAVHCKPLLHSLHRCQPLFCIVKVHCQPLLHSIHRCQPLFFIFIVHCQPLLHSLHCYQPLFYIVKGHCQPLLDSIHCCQPLYCSP